MKKSVHFSFFGIVLIAAVASLAQNPPAPPQSHTAPVVTGSRPQVPAQPPAAPPPPSAKPQLPPGPENVQAVPAPGQPPPYVSAAPSESQGQAPVPPQPPPQPNMETSAPPTADADMPVFQNPEGYHYDPTGRRDPFKPYGESQTTTAPEVGGPETPATPPEPLQAFDVSQFRLLGIIWQVKDPKAMVLDPNGRTHLLRKQTKIGRNNGFVAAIREGEVIVVEPSVGENGVQTAITRILNIK